jgi:hypothetical protein
MINVALASDAGAWSVTGKNLAGAVSSRGWPAGLGVGCAAVGGELLVVGVVAGAFGPELAGGAHHLGAECTQLGGDGLIGQLPVRVKRPP